MSPFMYILALTAIRRPNKPDFTQIGTQNSWVCSPRLAEDRSPTIELYIASEALQPNTKYTPGPPFCTGSTHVFIGVAFHNMPKFGCRANQ